MPPDRMTGRVDRVDYTNGSVGNQWTTISGVKYATYWDSRTKNWEVGNMVSFKVYYAKLHDADVHMTPHAKMIRRLP